MPPVSRREMLGLLAIAAATTAGLPLISCQSKPKLNAVPGLPQLQFANSRTGFAFASESEKHTLVGNAESAARAEAILAALHDRQTDNLLPKLFRVPDRAATVEELARVHSREYIAKVQNATQAGSYLGNGRWSPYAGPFAFSAAASAAGSALSLVHAIDDGIITNGFSLTRPPGHHAAHDHAAGYCIFNNVAVAVQSLQAKKPRRIAIVDFDVHHGDGIQDCFYRDANVLYVSTHQDDWPFTGKAEMTGAGPGLGTNINIPLPLHAGDAGLSRVYEQIVIPALRRFKPEIIVVAAGFDGHWRDPQGSFELTLSGLAQISQQLNAVASEICQGKIAYVLEGGYQLQALGTGVANLVTQLASSTSTTAVDPLGHSQVQVANVDAVIRKVRKIHKL